MATAAKAIKERRALLSALEKSGGNKAKWWEHKEKILSEWMETSAEELTVEGAVDLIKQQLQRGNAYPHLRFKCWKHVIIELAALVEDEVGGGAQYGLMRRRSSVGASGGGVRDEALAVAAGGGDGGDGGDDDDKSSSSDQADLSGMSFVERQQHWLKRKELSLEQKAKEMVNEKDGHSFSPDVKNSQASMRPAQASAVENKMTQEVAEQERALRRASFKRRDSQRSMAGIPDPEKSNSPPRRGSVAKTKDGKKRVAVKRNRRTTAPQLGVTDADLAKVTKEQEAIADALAAVAAAKATIDSSAADKLVAAETAAAGGDTATPGSEEEKEEEEEEADGGAEGRGQGQEQQDGKPAVEGGEGEGDARENQTVFFCKQQAGKGHYRVRDVSAFILTSTYKRKDRVTREQGLSLLVGKKEAPPHEEKIISAIFDLDVFTEESARLWWANNGHRFEDMKSMEEKEAMKAREDMHDEAVRKLPSGGIARAGGRAGERRYSAPVGLVGGVGAGGGQGGANFTPFQAKPQQTATLV